MAVYLVVLLSLLNSISQRGSKVAVSLYALELGAGIVARKWADWQADACFIDDTGGFGASWIDNLYRLGHTPLGSPFSRRANDPRYDNKRTEMYFEAVDWIRRGGQLPPGQASHELIAAWSQTTYSFRGDRLLLEPKEQVKSRLGYSPDDADAFVLTFAQPVAAGSGSSYGGPRGKPGRALVAYDVLKL